MRVYFCVFVFVLLGACGLCAELHIVDMVDVDLFEKKLGDGWVRRNGLIIEDESSINKLPEDHRPPARMVFGQMKPHGATGCGAFTFVRTKSPMNYVTVRVFKFSSAEKALSFGKLKYEGEKNKSQYKKTSGKQEITYESLKRKKLVVIDRQYMVTSEQGGKDDLHALILKECVNLGGKKNKDAKAEVIKEPVKDSLVREFKDYGFSVKCSDKLVIDEYLPTLLTEQVHAGVLLHAKGKGVEAKKVKSAILLMQSVGKITSGKDNSNITLSVENNWAGAQKPTGKTYLELMAERFKVFKSPNAFEGEAEKKVFNDKVFYVRQAVNTRFQGIRTRQRYYVTCHKDNYICFIVSYNQGDSKNLELFESVIKSYDLIKGE